MGTSTQPAPDDFRGAMAATLALFCEEVVGKRNIDALDDVYTEDAHVLPPGSQMVLGRAAIKQFWSGVIEAVDAKTAELTSIEVIPTGEGIIEIGRAVITMGPDGEGRMEAKYVVYWRQEDDRWKWHVDIWNPNS
jgi:ketosteroid isomerase-like protein